MARTRLQISKTDIVKLFDSHDKRVFRRSDIAEILRVYKDFWRLAQRTGVDELIDFLGTVALKTIELRFPSKSERRFIWRSASAYEVALSLRPRTYLTHYTATYLHDLTEQIPTTIYVNHEQPPKRWANAELEQARIDAAFRRSQRISKCIAPYDDQSICLLNGMFTGGLGVTDRKGSEGESLRLTDLERTLIDIAVRPAYAGGVFEVLSAYRAAAAKASVDKLADLLRRLGYIYPYHQAIGFYIEKSGAYDPSDIRAFESIEIRYDFYLTHQMRDTDYSKRWRLYFPKGI